MLNVKPLDFEVQDFLLYDEIRFYKAQCLGYTFLIEAEELDDKKFEILLKIYSSENEEDFYDFEETFDDLQNAKSGANYWLYKKINEVVSCN